MMDTSLDSRAGGVARRAGVTPTSQVQRRATLLLVRFRYRIITRKWDDENPSWPRTARSSPSPAWPRTPREIYPIPSQARWGCSDSA
jgi:hypothetical protein